MDRRTYLATIGTALIAGCGSQSGSEGTETTGQSATPTSTLTPTDTATPTAIETDTETETETETETPLTEPELEGMAPVGLSDASRDIFDYAMDSLGANAGPMLLGTTAAVPVEMASGITP